MSANYPDPTPPQQGIGRLLDTAWRKQVRFVDENGRAVVQSVPDEDAFYLGSHAISNDTFSGMGRLMGKLQAIEKAVRETQPHAMAEEMCRQIEQIRSPMRLAIAAKNSEGMRAGQAVSTLQDKMGRHRTEHYYDSPEEKAYGILDRIRGDRNRRD